MPGWKDRTFSTERMTFAHYTFTAGATIHEHCHSNEEVWTVLEGELQVTVGGETLVDARPGRDRSAKYCAFGTSHHRR